MTRLSSLALASAVIAASLSFTVPAVAAPVADGNAILVHYGDLDLSTEAGRDMLDRRVQRAANKLCHAGGERDVGFIQACRANVMETTNPAVQVAIRDSANRLAGADTSLRAALR